MADIKTCLWVVIVRDFNTCPKLWMIFSCSFTLHAMPDFTRLNASSLTNVKSLIQPTKVPSLPPFFYLFSLPLSLFLTFSLSLFLFLFHSMLLLLSLSLSHTHTHTHILLHPGRGKKCLIFTSKAATHVNLICLSLTIT